MMRRGRTREELGEEGLATAELYGRKELGFSRVWVAGSVFPHRLGLGGGPSPGPHRHTLATLGSQNSVYSRWNGVEVSGPEGIPQLLEKGNQ